ncbi:MAG TPA: SDR family oxidoreductase [Vicinamibacteria bacterium]|jgi:NAD(P)-dependent dehydrogenase (short-subunit alcohol dehydrogenase family)
MLAGRTCLVTGANAGIGKEIARGLARLGGRVVLACRSGERGEAARQEIARTTGNWEVDLLIVDVSSQSSLRAAAQTLAERHPGLHVLVNNAGIFSRERRESVDGIELTWATNVLGYFLLTELLLERVRASAPARIVNVASELAGGLDLEDVEFERRRYDATAAYSQSKQADRTFTWALDRRLRGSGVTANAMHPGAVDTRLLRQAFGSMRGRTPEEGADTAVWLASSPEVEGVSGRWWVDRRERRCRFRNEEEEERLWDLCAAMTMAARSA